MMSVSGIHGHILEITVVGCRKLKDTEWISRQDPYVCLDYASTKVRTRTCTDGGKEPIFQEKFVFTLIEGLRELKILVWNSNTLTNDDFIGGGKVLLNTVLSTGYDDNSWPIQTKNGRHAGEVRLIMHYPQANKTSPSYGAAASPYAMPSAMYSTPPLASTASYPPAFGTVPSSHPTYLHNSATYAPRPYPPTNTSAYHSAYSAYPAYPPAQYSYPPQASSSYPSQPSYHPGPFPGIYPPPPY